MSKKSEFINYIEMAINAYPTPMSEDAFAYWNALKGSDDTEKPVFTDNGKLIMKYLQELPDDTKLLRAKDIAEGMFISARTISGSMRKLVSDGFVEKIGKDPILYSLTEKGKDITIED